MSESLVQKIQLTTISLFIFLGGLALVTIYAVCCAMDWMMASPDHRNLLRAVPAIESAGVFPLDIQPLHQWSKVTARQMGGYQYVLSYGLVFMLLLAGILARYRFQSFVAQSERVKAFSFYLLFSSSLLVYTILFPTVFFMIHMDQLHPIEGDAIYLHDLQLFVLDQIGRSLFFDFLEAMRIPWSNLDYDDDADFAFKALVGFYRFMIPAALLFVFFPLSEKPSPPQRPDKAGEPPVAPVAPVADAPANQVVRPGTSA